MDKITDLTDLVVCKYSQYKIIVLAGVSTYSVKYLHKTYIVLFELKIAVSQFVPPELVRVLNVQLPPLLALPGSVPHTVALLQPHPGVLLQKLGEGFHSSGFPGVVNNSVVPRLDQLEAWRLLDI